MSGLHRSYSVWWAALLTIGGVLEAVAIYRRGPGDTLSEHVWAVMLGWPGAPIYAVLAWVLLWHFPWGARRPLSWPDALAVLAGLALWLIARNNNPGLRP